jgi:hypothetical protein
MISPWGGLSFLSAYDTMYPLTISRMQVSKMPLQIKDLLHNIIIEKSE